MAAMRDVSNGPEAGVSADEAFELARRHLVQPWPYAGLIGSESVQRFVEAGYDVVGLENDMRARFFGPTASTRCRSSSSSSGRSSSTRLGSFPAT